MLNATVEMFMAQYFLMKVTLGKYLTNSKDLFTALSRICLIPEADIDTLYALAENETAKRINTDKDFMQYQRVQKYAQLVGSEQNGNAEWEEIARIKGNSILIVQSHNLILHADASRNVVYTYLSSAATSGTIIAMQIMGILQCEGIFLDKNEKAGLKMLSKAADWNDSISILALLHYSTKNREYNMARLRHVLGDTPFNHLYNAATGKYAISEDIDIGEVKLLDKAFSSGVLKREVYDPKYARILGSKALYLKDKEKAVFTQNKEQLSIIGDLPLKLSHKSITAVDTTAVQKVALKRDNETKAVVRGLKNSDLRELTSYRPLCICSDSNYILNMYAKAIAENSKTTHVEMIDIGELIEYDFEPTPNNIFVRSIDEDKDNRFLLFYCGEISEKRFDATKSILQSSRRAKFHLNNPSVTLNLSSILPICFCDKKNAPLLKPYCGMVSLETVAVDELPKVIKDILNTKEQLYGVGKIKINGEVSAVFGSQEIDVIEKLIDAAVCAQREKGADITLSNDIIKEYNFENDSPKIGFGGFAYGKDY